jgi:hypothetical protein
MRKKSKRLSKKIPRAIVKQKIPKAVVLPMIVGEKNQSVVVPEQVNIERSEQVNIERSTRGPIYDIIKNTIYKLGNLATYSSKQIILLLNTMSNLTSNFNSLSFVFTSLEKLLSVGTFVGTTSFSLLLSLHPNIIGPLSGFTTGLSIGYVLGSFIGNSLWPANSTLNALYTILSFGTNVSYTGVFTGLIAAPIATFKLAQIFGDLADSFFMYKTNSSIATFILTKCTFALVGGAMLMLLTNNIVSIATITGIFYELSKGVSFLTSNYSLIPTLSLIFNLNAFKNLFIAGDYMGIVQKGATQLFINLLVNWLTGSSVLASQPTVQEEQVVLTLINEIPKTPIPNVSSWTSIAEYLKSLIVSFTTIFTASPGGILCAWLCGCVVVIFVVYSLWNRRINLNFGNFEDKRVADIVQDLDTEELTDMIDKQSMIDNQQLNDNLQTLQSSVDKVQDQTLQPVNNLEHDAQILQCCIYFIVNFELFSSIVNEEKNNQDIVNSIVSLEENHFDKCKIVANSLKSFRLKTLQNPNLIDYNALLTLLKTSLEQILKLVETINNVQEKDFTLAKINAIAQQTQIAIGFKQVRLNL